MRFTELRLKGSRGSCRGDFAIVEVNGVGLFVGDQDADSIGDGTPASLKGPPVKRIAVPVGSVEYAVPAVEAEEDRATYGDLGDWPDRLDKRTDADRTARLNAMHTGTYKGGE